jgi:hypothetical protein
MNRKVGIVFAIAASCATMTLSGCSLIGLGVGSIIDHSKPGTYIPVAQDQTVKPGRKIMVIKTNGDTLTGEYVGMDDHTLTD